ncbi:MAG: type II secretion system protein GspN [Polyangiaceae bacterium]|nr:type II secretion system protein GspN [Polyangiaceae bacterium]MCW5791913.1 type II secretion system protein GspN [Polyangiaceae bacterium]
MRRVLRYLGFAAFYSVALTAGLYLTLPTERAKVALETEFNARQDGENPLTMKIGELDTYWLSGLELKDVELTGQPTVDADGKVGKAERYLIDAARVRASILSAVTGGLSVGFDAEAFSGTLDGTYKAEGESKDIRISLQDLAAGELPMLQRTTGIPMQGTLSGEVELTLPTGKLSESEGSVELTVSGLRVADGKTKIRDTLALPEINAGTLRLRAEIKAGSLTIQELKCDGKDITVIVEGKVRLRDPVESSLAEMTLRYQFKDAYRSKNEMTEALLGKEGGPPGVLDLDPSVRRAKQPDGFYAWRLSGPLSKLKFDPLSGAAGRAPARQGLRNRLR